MDKYNNEPEDIKEILDHLEMTEKKEKPYVVKEIISDITFETNYFWHNSIIIPLKNFIRGIYNLWRWRKIIWRDRWWDYDYLLDILEFKLKDMEYNWGKNTHYVGDYDDKETLKKIINDLEWMRTADEFSKGYAEEYKKRSTRLFGRLARNHQKFWD